MQVAIGEIVKAQGIKGEVKVKVFQNDCSYLAELEELYVNLTPCKVRSISLRANFAYIYFDGVNDRNAAELLVGKSINIESSLLPPLASDEFYISDIIGLSVFLDSGKSVGKVVDINNFGSADVYTIKGDKVVRFPYLTRLVKSVDVSAKMMVLYENIFQEVSVYED